MKTASFIHSKTIRHLPVTPTCHVACHGVGRRGDRRWEPMPRRSYSAKAGWRRRTKTTLFAAGIAVLATIYLPAEKLFAQPLQLVLNDGESGETRWPSRRGPVVPASSQPDQLIPVALQLLSNAPEPDMPPPTNWIRADSAAPCTSTQTRDPSGTKADVATPNLGVSQAVAGTSDAACPCHDCRDASTNALSIVLDFSYYVMNADGFRGTKNFPNGNFPDGIFPTGAQLDTVLGTGWTHSFNILLFSQAGSMFLFDRNGRITKYQRNLDGSFTAGPGEFRTLVPQSGGTFVLTQKDNTMLTFASVPGTPFSLGDAVYRLVQILDRNNNTVTLDYSAGNLIRVTDTYGRATTFTYNANQHLASVTDPLGRSTTLTYDNVTGTKLMTITDPLNKTIAYAYNSLFQLTSKIDKDGRLFSYSYTNNQPTGSTDSLGGSNFNLSNPINWATDPAAPKNQLLVYLPSVTTKADGRGNLWQYEYDSRGYLTRMTAPDGASTAYTYDPATLMVKSVTDANHHTTEYEYDSRGNRTKITLAAPFNYVTTFTYEPVFNMVTSMTDHRRRVTTYAYDGRGNRILETDPLLQTRHWTYDTHGKVLTETDKRGNTTIYHYDAFGNRDMITAPPPLSYITTMTYDIVGNLKTRTDPNNHTTSFDYDGLNRLIRETDPAGKITQALYDGQGNRKQLIDRNDHTTMFEYDERQRLIKTTDALGQMTTPMYDLNNNRTSITDKNGHTTAFEYDLQNRLRRTRDAEGNVNMMTYDDAGNLTSSTDANGHTTTYLYDELNRRRRVTDALGYITVFEYDMGASGCGACGATPGSNLITKQTDGNGKVTYYRYDELDRLTTIIRKEGDTADVIDASDAVTSYTYDRSNNRMSMTEPDGNRTDYEYDVLNRRTRETNAAGDVTYFTYDGANNLSTLTAPNSNVTTSSYDALDRMIQADDSIGRIANYTYDNVGNRLSQADGNGHTTHYTYDDINRPTIVTDALTQRTVTQYDPVGNILTITDREGHITTNIYDKINRRISSTDALDHTTRYQYDGVGNLLKITDANRHATQYLYDDINRVKTKIYADPPPNTRTFAYDAVNLISRTDQKNQTTVYTYNDLYFLMTRTYPASPADAFSYDLSGRMLSAERGGWVVTFMYDGANRVRETKQNGKTINYLYDIPGRTRTVTYPGGRSITDRMDLRSRLSIIAETAASPPPIVQYAYDLGNRVVTRSYRNGTLATYSYNANDWVLSLEHTLGMTLVAGFGYDFDKEGNKKSEGNRHNTTRSEGYQYDNIYRLTDYKVGALVGSSVPAPVTQTQYNLDPLGNWNRKTTDAVTQTRRHNQVNELTTLDGTNLTYDDNGNLQSDASYTYVYDEENRLTRVTRNSDAAIVGQYQYDALSRRVQKTANPAGVPSTTRYFHDGARIIEEQDTLDATQATYTYGNYIDEVLTMDRGAQTFYYHQNSLWSAEAITDAAGDAVERYAYDAYGLPAIFNGAGAAIAPNAWGTPHSGIGNPWMFTGRQLEEETGLYFYRARYYDAARGRLLSRDPIGEDGGLNLYAYVANNPINRIDPLGLDTEFNFTDGSKQTASNAEEFQSIADNAANGSILKITVTGHGSPDDNGGANVQGLSIRDENAGDISVDPHGNAVLTHPAWQANQWRTLSSLLAGKMSPNGTITLNGCLTGVRADPDNIAKAISKALPNVPVTGQNQNLHFIPWTDFTIPYPGDTTTTYVNGKPAVPAAARVAACYGECLTFLHPPPYSMSEKTWCLLICGSAFVTGNLQPARAPAPMPATPQCFCPDTTGNPTWTEDLGPGPR